MCMLNWLLVVASRQPEGLGQICIATLLTVLVLVLAAIASVMEKLPEGIRTRVG